MEVRAPVIVGVYPMRIARFVFEHPSATPNGHGSAHGVHAPVASVRDPATEPIADEAG